MDPVCVVYLQGLGTDEDALIDILCSRSNNQMARMKAAYQRCKDLALSNTVVPLF